MMQNLFVSRHAIVASMLLGVCLASSKPTIWYNLECKIGSGKVQKYKKVELEGGSLTLDEQTFTITKDAWSSQSFVLRGLCPGKGKKKCQHFFKRSYTPVGS